MHWLPFLPAPLQETALPLPDQTASVLIDVLLCADSSSARDALVEVLQIDPALALWTVCAADLGRSAPISIGQLADQLLDQLPGCLAEAGPDAWPTKALDDSDAKAFASQAARHVAVAERAAELATQYGGEVRDRAYCVGLLVSAIDWLPDGNTTESSDAPALLPEWMLPITIAKESGETFREVECALEAQATADGLEPDSRTLRWWSEPAPLAHRLPELAQRLMRLEQLENRFAQELLDEKLRALYKLAAGAGHEINNPLGSIAGRAQLLLRDEVDPERRRTLAKINSQAFRAHEMISDMMLFAKPPVPVRESVDLVELADQVLDGLREEADRRNTTIVYQGQRDPVIVAVDQTQITVVMRAMCLNAMEALGSGGRIELGVESLGDLGSPSEAAITVRDNGPGMTDDQRRHLFDPFYSGREAGRGLGFGLSKSWRIVTNHGGRIDVHSEPGHGAKFTILLPAA
jgi:signal transduction histidine kinase